MNITDIDDKIIKKANQVNNFFSSSVILKSIPKKCAQSHRSEHLQYAQDLSMLMLNYYFNEDFLNSSYFTQIFFFFKRHLKNILINLNLVSQTKQTDLLKNIKNNPKFFLNIKKNLLKYSKYLRLIWIKI